MLYSAIPVGCCDNDIIVQNVNIESDEDDPLGTDHALDVETKSKTYSETDTVSEITHQPCSSRKSSDLSFNWNKTVSVNNVQFCPLSNIGVRNADEIDDDASALDIFSLFVDDRLLQLGYTVPFMLDVVKKDTIVTVHERHTADSHELLVKWFQRLTSVTSVTCVVDREHSITKAVKAVFPDANIVYCWNHVLGYITYYASLLILHKRQSYFQELRKN